MLYLERKEFWFSDKTSSAARMYSTVTAQEASTSCKILRKLPEAPSTTEELNAWGQLLSLEEEQNERVTVWYHTLFSPWNRGEDSFSNFVQGECWVWYIWRHYKYFCSGGKASLTVMQHQQRRSQTTEHHTGTQWGGQQWESRCSAAWWMAPLQTQQ